MSRIQPSARAQIGTRLRAAAVALPAVVLLLAGASCLPGGGFAGGAGDLDDDGVPDELDNCSARANPTQLDSDGDNFGSACDPDYDGNERVGLSDFNLLRSQFGLREDDPDYDRDVDHTGDGVIGLADFNVLRLLFGRPPGPSGLGVPDGWNRVRGRVTALPDLDPIALPEARVFLRTLAVGVERPPDTASDIAGFYETSTQPVADRYQVCAAAPGFTTFCHPDPVDFDTRKRFLEIRDLTLQPVGDAIRGTVLLSDGSPCAEIPRVRLLDDRGVLHGDVATNGAGAYVAATLPPLGAVRFEVRCAGLLVEDERSLDERERGGEQPVDWTLPNAPPTIDWIAVRDAQGQSLRFVTPGSSVFLVADARDPNGDDLVHRWWDEAGSVVSQDASGIPWTAPAASQLDTVFLEVDDGRGGVTREKLTLRIGEALDKFAGTVLDDAGSVLVGAAVSVDGAEVATEAEGRFALAVPAAAFHVLTVDHPGYARHVERVHQGAAGVEIRLHPLAFTPFDPSEEILLWDGTRGASLRIPPNSLVDEAGNEPTGRVYVGIHTHDPTSEAPLGSRVLATGAGAPQAYAGVQGTSVEIVDDGGTRFQLAPGEEAIVGFQAPHAPQQDLPRTLTLAHLDEATGLWERIGEAERVGSRYEGLVSSFSAWSTGSGAAGDTACLRVVTQGALQLPARLRVYTQPGIVPFDVDFVDEYTLQERENAIFRLPPNHFARLELRVFTDPETVIGTTFVATGDAVSPPEPAYPYAACEHVEVGADLPIMESEYSGPPHFLYRYGTGDEANAQAYYQSIGAVPAKDNFQKWLEANGFVPADRFEDVTFFNPNEIGLTRRANCKVLLGPPRTTACYVTKYGHVGESPFDSLWDGLAGLYPGDTVAMEFTLVPGETFQRSVKFFIYAPADTPAQQPLKTHTAFDTDGDTKYVPNVCQHCHGAYSPQFVVFDPHQYQYLGVGQSHLGNVQERFRQFNAQINLVLPPSSPPWVPSGINPALQLIEDLYGDDIFLPGTAAGPGLHGDVAYDEVVKPYCRTCHMFSAFPFEFVPAGSNPSRHFGGLASVAHSHMCTGEMPHAMQPQLALWSSANPFLPGIFPLGCIEPNAAPIIQITAPADGFDVGFGGLSLETYSATVSDAEDGTSCCSVVWSGDSDVMGYGLEVDYVFGSSGNHQVCAIATDSSGKTGQDCITVSSSNRPPNVTIHVPTPAQTVYQGTPVNLWGVAVDFNEPYLNLPCSALGWTFPSGPLPRPAPVNDCQPVVTFAQVGTYSVRLDASDGTDSDFAVSSVVVQDVPFGSPPSVTITSPDYGSLYPPDAPLLLQATIITFGGGAITRQWTVDPGFGPPIPISTANPGNWVPSSTLLGDCGSQPVEIRLNATNANGTGTDARTIEIGWPPC
jgi:hypothetical protein